MMFCVVAFLMLFLKAKLQKIAAAEIPECSEWR